MRRTPLPLLRRPLTLSGALSTALLAAAAAASPAAPGPGTQSTDEQAEHFAAARADELCGDASTYYTMLPVHPGVAARAVSMLPAGFRVIYVVREPVSRTISHHYHEHTAGRAGADRRVGSFRRGACLHRRDGADQVHEPPPRRAVLDLGEGR